ncbi:MAG TPA: hypothetical protein VN110_01220, partial [Sphingobium sp.]|nr:hypothetical protein [Sphingobium sp.]
LVICRDIVAEFGGDLRASHPGEPGFPTPQGAQCGAVFILTLRKADAGHGAQAISYRHDPKP